MYDSNDRLTIEGAKQVIASGGSVLIGGVLHNDIRTLPSAAKLSTFNAVTRKQAENAITEGGKFTYQGKTYTDIKNLPSEAEFDADNRDSRQEARSQLQKEIDERQKQLDEADKLDQEAAQTSQRAAAIRSGNRAGAGAAAGAITGTRADDTSETFGHGDNKYPLAHFDQYADEDAILAAEVPGVGEATAKDIIKARKKRDAGK